MRSAKGSITKLDGGRWRVSVEGAPDHATGKRRRVTKVVRGTRKQAEETRVRMLVDQGAEVVDSTMTLRQYVETVYSPAKAELIKQGKFKRSTLANYEDRLRLHVYGTFGDVPLKDITAQRVRRWLSGFEEPKKAKEAYKVLSSVLSFAVYDMQLKENPCKRVKCPETARYQPRPLDVEDIEVYRYFFRGESVEAAVLLAIGGGFRRGEICALDVEDIDLKTGEVTIDDAYIVVRGEATAETPKSESGTRKVHLPMGIVRRLAEILPHRGPVLPGRDGGRMYPSAVTRAFERVRDRLPEGVPRIPLKDLRHSSLTLAYESGAEALALKDRGGHSNIDTTRRYYVRPKGNRDAQIAEAMDAVLDPKPEPEPTVGFEVLADTLERF